MEEGLIHARPSKQKLNSKISTDTELIGGSDYLPYALWHIFFFKSQGYKIKTKVIFQDNESTIKLLQNGKRSSGNQTCHIDIRYFWIADCLKQEDIKIEYCPTECTLGDFFTKLLEDSLFVTMRDICQGSILILELKVRHKHKQDTIENSTEINLLLTRSVLEIMRQATEIH